MLVSYGAISGLEVRRKNATRESTSTLKAWLCQHIKNPYPTKGEKIMLAIVTRMTLTQVNICYCCCFFFAFVLFVIRNLNLYLSLGQLSVSSLLSVLHIVILYFTVNL